MTNRHAATNGQGVGGAVDDDGGERGNINHDGVAHVFKRDAPAVATAADNERAAVLFRVRDLCAVSIATSGGQGEEGHAQ